MSSTLAPTSWPHQKAHGLTASQSLPCLWINGSLLGTPRWNSGMLGQATGKAPYVGALRFPGRSYRDFLPGLQKTRIKPSTVRGPRAALTSAGGTLREESRKAHGLNPGLTRGCTCKPEGLPRWCGGRAGGKTPPLISLLLGKSFSLLKPQFP